MSQYLKLIQASTPYANRMTRLRNRIFGDIVGPIDQKSTRIVRILSAKPIYMQEDVVDYYYRVSEAYHLMAKLRNYGLFRDEHFDFQMEMRRLRKLRGKVKPQKGQGKQAVNKAQKP